MLIINNTESEYSKLIKLFIDQLPETMRKDKNFKVIVKIEKVDIESSNEARYRREIIKDNELHIFIVDSDISKLLKYLTFNEILNILLERFVDAIDADSFYNQFSIIFDKFHYQEKMIEIFKDDSVYSKTKEALLSNSHNNFVEAAEKISRYINQKSSDSQNIFDFSALMDQKEDLKRFQAFNDTFLGEVIKHIQTNKPDFLLNKKALDFFQFEQPHTKKLAGISGRNVLLGLVVSSIYKIGKTEQKYNRALTSLSKNGSMKDVLDYITNDLITENEEFINYQSKRLTTVSDKIEQVKKQINQINIPKKFTSEIHYLELDEYYKKHNQNDFGHNVSRSQVLQNYRNNKKKQLQILNINNHKRWINSITSKQVELSDGIITLSYWRLFYYYHELYKNLRNLHSEKSLNTIINTFLKYYYFIHFDLYDEILNYFNQINNDIDVDLEETYKKIAEIETNDYKSKPAILDKLRSDHEDLIKLKDEFENIALVKLKEDGKDLIDLHFNTAIIEKILSEYIIAISNHELTLKSLFEEDKDISELL